MFGLRLTSATLLGITTDDDLIAAGHDARPSPADRHGRSRGATGAAYFAVRNALPAAWSASLRAAAVGLFTGPTCSTPRSPTPTLLSRSRSRWRPSFGCRHRALVIAITLKRLLVLVPWSAGR